MTLRTAVGFLAAATLPAADLPVREVVLYKHGVGYFERAGQLAAGESARLDFKANEMDDVLKSLTIQEKGGGKIAGVRYDSSEPLEQKLSQFPFRIGEAQPLSAVLDQLKGARVELHFGAQTVTGAIVSGRVAPASDKQPEREQLTIWVDGGELRTVDLAAATSIRFTDPKLQLQFQDYLAAVLGAKSKERRGVYIDSTDAKAREVQASYMIPAPVWKSSYRLIFDAAPQPTLEGWAIVDNTTGEDWTNVRLSLVSGRPISFISHLYEPRYITRPVAELPDERAAAPVLHEGAVADALVGGFPKAMAAAPPAPAAQMERMSQLARPQQSAGMAMTPIAAAATTRELGDLFEYRIPTPVTVRKSESAMLPFLQQQVSARKLLIYSDPSSQHPRNAAELTNSTGKTLDGGPVTVFESGAYGGEALMDTLKGSDKRLISYGVDLGTRVTTAFDSKAEIVREVHVRRGVLTSKLSAAETRTYTIRNVDQKAKTLLIEHPVRANYHLLNPKPVETTASAYRFEVKLAPGATEKLAVEEERVYDNTFTLTNMNPDLLGAFLSNRTLSAAARKQLETIADRKRQATEAEAEIRQLNTQIESMSRDQERIRQNIASLNAVSGQQEVVQNYARQLASREKELIGLRDRVVELQRKKAALESEINSLIEKMEF